MLRIWTHSFSWSFLLLPLSTGKYLHRKIVTKWWENGDKMVTASFKYCIVVFRHKIFLVILMFFVPFIPFSPYFGYVFLIKYDRIILDFRDEKTLKALPCFATAFKKLRKVTLLSSSCIKWEFFWIISRALLSNPISFRL